MKNRILLVAVAVGAMCLFSCETKVSNSTKSSCDTLVVTLTGDISTDAEALANHSMEVSRKMIDGADVEKEMKQIQQCIDSAKSLYEAQGKRTEFMIAFNEKMAKGVSAVAAELKRDSTNETENTK